MSSHTSHSNIKVGLVGIGRWGKNIARELHKRGVLYAYAHNSRDENKRWMAAEFPDCLCMSTEEMLALNTITALVIATPIDTHAQLAHVALAAKKHVFVEKPLATNADVVQRLHTLAEQQSRCLFTGYLFMYDPQLLPIVERVQKQSNWTYTTTWKKWGTFDSPITTNLLVHDIALATMLLGSPVTILAMTRSDKNKLEITLHHPRGEAAIHLDRAYTGERLRSTRIANTKESFTFSPSPNLLGVELDRFLGYAQDERHVDVNKTIDLVVANVLQDIQ